MGIVGENPLPLGQSVIAPFVQSEYVLGMQHGKFSCGYNLFQLSFTFAPCKGVPINRKGARSSDSTVSTSTPDMTAPMQKTTPSVYRVEEDDTCNQQQ